MTPTQNPQNKPVGFAIELLPDTELGHAMLIVEDEERHYEPVGIALTIREAKEMAQNDMRSRMDRVDRGEDGVLCPNEYKLWARGLWGIQQVAATWGISDL